jgi:hypothetical protein
MPYWDYNEDYYTNENNYNHYHADAAIPDAPENLPDPEGIIRFNPVRFLSKLINATVKKPHSNNRLHNSMMTFGNVIYPPLFRPSVVFQEYATTPSSDSFDSAWLLRSDEYVDNLPAFDKYILNLYSRNGDEVVNITLRHGEINEKVDELLNKMNYESRSPFAVPLFRENNDLRAEYFVGTGSRLTTLGRNRLNALYSQYITSDEIKLAYVQKYANELRRVIRSAPPVARQQIVFRAINNDYLEVYEHAKTTVKGFTSTSFDPHAVSYYANNHSYTNVYEMILTPGTHAISMRTVSAFPDEHEILLDYDCYVAPLEKHEKLMINTVYPSALYDKALLPKAYLNSREVIVVTAQDAAVGTGAGAGATNNLFQGFGLSGGRTATKRLSAHLTRKQKSAHKSATTRSIKRMQPSDANLPFWKVRDQTIPRLSADPIPEKERIALTNAANAYMAAIYPKKYMKNSKKPTIQQVR